MGEKVGRIEQEFLLGAISEQHIEMRVHGKELQVHGKAIEGEDNVLTIQCDTQEGKLFKAGEPVRIYFSYYGHTMMFETVVKEPGEILTLKIPPGMVKNLERKFERIPNPAGLSMSFIHEDVKVQLSFPESREFRQVDEPVVFEHFDAGGIDKLIAQFREKSTDYADINSIHMFRNREPSTFEEKLIVDTGKSIFLPQVERGLPKSTEYAQQPIVTEEYFPDSTVEEGDYLGFTRQQAHNYFREKVDDHIFSELYCPVIYLQYVVGYIYLANSSKRKRPFTLNTLDFAQEFSYVLAYVLKESGYFHPNKKEKRTFKADIINASASGVLFAYPSDELANEIRVYTDLDMVLYVGKRAIKVNGRVMRRYETEKSTFFGVQYMEMQPEDFRFLFDYLYGRPFTEKDDQFWEGGAAPPRVEL
jgi:c-di-GMP-binding flagellar brake protein YcgR